MILSLVIILILGASIFRGLHRGLVLEVLYTVGYIVIFFAARWYTASFANFLSNTFGTISTNTISNATIMNSISFIILMMAGWAIIRLIARLSQAITWLPVIKQVNGLAGAAVALLFSYLITFVVLSISQYIPNDTYQNQLSQSTVAQMIITKTPAMSSKIINNYIIQTKQTQDVL